MLVRFRYLLYMDDEGYFDSIPKSIDEAARIDGCSHLETFHKIVLPLTLRIASTLIFCFLLGWSEYLFTLILCRGMK